jgi:hypothetical protein
MKWSLQAIKSLSYRGLSITVQIVGIGLLTGTWKWTTGVLAINVILILLYTGYDRLFGWIERVIKSPS